MALTRLDNLYSSKTGKYLYVSPDDFNATDELDNRGNSPLRPFLTIQRAFIEVARYSYLPGKNNDRFDQFSIMLMPGNHYIDNRPGTVDVINPEIRYIDGANLIQSNRQEIIDRAFAEIAIQYDEVTWGTDWVVPGDQVVVNELNRNFDAYRLIQRNKEEIVESAYQAMLDLNPGFVVPGTGGIDNNKCKRDIGFFIDAVSLDVVLGGGNKYTRKFIQSYFNAADNNWLSNTLEGEEQQSIQAFVAARDGMVDAVSNQLTYKDLSITADPSTGSNVDQNSCANIQNLIITLSAIITDRIIAGTLDGLVGETSSPAKGDGENSAKADIAIIVDAIISDLKTGGNSNIIQVARSYFDKSGVPISDGLIGQKDQSIVAFTAAADMMRKAVRNRLYEKDLTVLAGPSVAGGTGLIQPVYPSGNDLACVDVQDTISSLVLTLTNIIEDENLSSLSDIEITGDVPVFNYNQALEEWNDNSVLDLGNPDNVFYKFNASTGGAIVPRGCSLIGYDLRRTVIRPLYVPDPADGTQARTSIFNLTGGCYLWQFTIKDGDLSSNSPLFDPVANVGKVYFQKGNTSQLAVPEYSHHKICIMEYAESEELDRYYTKVASSFSRFQPLIDDGELEALVQENRIVGPLSDTRRLASIKIIDSTPSGILTVEVATKIDHGYFVDQYVAILNNGLSDQLNGTFKVTATNIDGNPKVFRYQIPTVVAALGNSNLESGATYTSSNGLNTNAVAQAEIDSVESASPYVFNCSIRSTWGQCGMWADGSKATGFKSMVVAQYTGVSLQKDDRAFIRYDKFTNTWNQASLTDAFATVPYHTKGDAYWKDDWRNFHIRASDDSFVQCVSVFAVGFHDHFLMESGGDMSITNSNSNFGNTSLHAIGFKGFSFNQDKGGYITDIIPPQVINTSISNEEKVQYYTLDIQASNPQSNNTKLYLAGDDISNPANRPAATIGGYRIGAKSGEKLFVKLDDGVYNSTVTPSGFLRYTVGLETLNPGGISINDKAQDAANRIESNKEFIASEAYEYILEKYPNLLTNQNITISKCKRDIGYFIDATVSDLRLSGNVNTVQAAEGYFVGNNLVYIQNELSETIEALDYVKNLSIAAMRNFDYLIQNCSTSANSPLVNVGDTTGLVVGMGVSQYSPQSFTNGRLNAGATPLTSNITAGTYIKSIVNSTTIELGVFGSKLDQGAAKNALQNSSTAWLYFTLPFGAWNSDHNIIPNTDLSLVQDTGYPECSDIASIISQYFVDIALTLNQGINSVVKIEPVIDFVSLGQRATIFTVNTGGSTSNPHQFETGTPVRLVPKAKEGSNVDKKFIRLPKGFESNTKYYVIAPGRLTQPFDYSATTYFDGSDQTKLMFASTKENAGAGIYVYSPETESVHPDVEIEIQQFVLDESYDLHKFKCNFAIGDTRNIETAVVHIFDLPNASVIPQKIFFRQADDIIDSSLPQVVGQGTISTQTYYYARYGATKKFTVHTSHSDAIAGINEITFVENTGKNFYVFADKRISPLRFDATFSSVENATGLWYLEVLDESSGANIRSDSILTRFHNVNAYGPNSGKIRTLDTWFTRVNDTRQKEDRVYRLRYVIPKYLETVRDPLNGFVLKIRTDEKRRLVPQKIVLVPVSGNTQNTAVFQNPGGFQETLGLTKQQYITDIVNPIDPGIFDLSPEKRLGLYDPYFNPKIVETESNIAFTIQSARKTQNNYLEIIAFDHTIVNEALKNEIFTVVEISAPQGGSGQFTSGSTAPLITWSGNSTGFAIIQKYLFVNNKHYLILRITAGKIEYSSFIPTTFNQVVAPFQITANLVAKPNSVGDPEGKDKSNKKDFLYTIEGSNVYTLAPGDFINDDTGKRYQIQSVQDVGNIDDTFYIFDIDEIRERIAGQQDGVYYLTAVRGNISPFPTGAGVGENFKNYKFSQPISQLYPQNYKNDPVWFKQLNPVFNDVPPSVAAADNYIHGYVTINDSKNSETKEVVYDIIQQPAFENYSFVKSEDLTSPTLTPVGGSDVIEAQEGNARSGSEDRYIPISGDSEYPSEQKLYVELRRPSIARSGNHTFEYLGYGPGNYSTGFPLRQEVVLSDLQDFYAQSKKENGGIVFYTGLNSNGDLYIGNKKVNAITGEETFLERADLLDSEDDSDDAGGTLVTTFDVPVTFNDRITVEGTATFNNPVEINVGADEGTALRIYSVVDAALGDDISLSRSQHTDNNTGDITLGKNRINTAILGITPRQQLGLDGQGYSLRTHFVNSFGPTNVTPNQSNQYRFNNVQEISYSTLLKPVPGDILLKGSEVGLSGSLGWIFANYYTVIAGSNIQNITSDGVYITINWISTVTNQELNVVPGSQLRIINFSLNPNLNGTWIVISQGFSAAANSCRILVPIPPANGTVYPWASAPQNAFIQISRSNWKEVGLIGSETLRTNTETFGNYKLGINTLARASDTAYLRGFVDSPDENNISPRANLDLVGDTFISGKTVTITINNGVQNKVETSLDNAFLVGGNSLTPNNTATLRVSTTNNGRLGINTTNSQLNGSADGGIYNVALAVIGSSAISQNLRVGGTSSLIGDTTITGDLSVNGGDIKTTVSNTIFNLLNDTTFTGTLNLSNSVNIANIFRNASEINFGNLSNNQIINIGNPASTSTNISRTTIGGAYGNNETNSFLEVKTTSAKFWGDVQIGISRLIDESVSVNTSAGIVNFFSNSGSASKLDFATNASEITIAGQGGITTVRNSLTIDATLLVKGSSIINGGTASFSFNGTRSRLGSTISSHIGIIGVPLDKNVDFVTILSGSNNVLDAAGAGTWGGSFFQQAIATYNSDSGQSLGALSGNQYYLPLNTAPTYSEGDDLLIDSIVATGVHPEIVKVSSGGLVRVQSAPYYIIVERQPYGTFLPQKTNHPDSTTVKKINVSLDSTWLTSDVDGSGTVDQFNLAEFGGSLVEGDYIIVSRNTTGTSGEVVQIGASVGSFAKTFTVKNGANVTKFEVNSVTGATIVSDSISLGGLTVYGPTNLNGAITTTGTLTLNGGNFVINSSNGSTNKLTLTNSTGDLYISGDLTVNGNGIKSSTNTALTLSGSDVTVVGDLTVTGNDIKSSSGATVLTLSANDATFADKLTVTGDLTVDGGDFLVNSGGTERFNVNSNGSIDLGGVTQYFTPTGGRKWVYISTSSNTQNTISDEERLVSNTNYFVNPIGSGSILILLLPTTANNGDVIRIVDVAGQLKYNTQLLLRAPTGVRVQGDSTGSALGLTTGTYDGGELIVNTPNAAFGLVYVGSSDGNQVSIPSTYRGWWLMEI